MASGAQSGFEGFGPPDPTDRLFLALVPDAETAVSIAALAQAQCRRLGLRGRPLAADRLHVTLFHLGDRVGVPDDVVAATARAVSAMRSAPLELAFDGVGSFATRRTQKPFVLKAFQGNEALHAFHARLAGELRKSGLGEFTKGPFEPHVTLAYDAALVPFEPTPAIGWTAGEVVLVHSLLGRTRHLPLARWSLEA